MESCTLLTIEDEEPIRRSIRAFFEDLEFTVMDAGDGEKGLELFRQRQPAVVLVDLRMPGMTGLDVIDVLSREAPETPVVVLSGTGVVADAIEAIRRGAWDYIMKPIKDMAELEHVVNGVLERARLREESRRYHTSLEEEIELRTRELRESEERYRDLVENMNDAIYVVDEGGTISYISPVIERMAGYRPDEVIGRDFRDFFLNEARDQMTAEYRGFLAGESRNGEYVLLNKSGEPLWVRASSRPIWDGGRIAGIQGILTDITDRKTAEQQLENKARELEVLNLLGREMGQDLSVDAIVNRVLRAAKTSLQSDLVALFLKDGNDLILKGFQPHGQAFSEEDVPAHHVGECLCGIAAREGATVYSVDIHTDPRCTYDECKRAGLRSFAALALKSAGEVIGVLGLASQKTRDFQVSSSFLEALGNQTATGLKNALLFEKVRSDAIELQTRLEQIQETQKEKEELMLQLHRSQKMEAIGTLAGGIAHDFNNILTPIVMGTEMALMNVPPDNRANRMLERVLDAGARAKDLVNQILTFSRQDDLEKGPMQVGPILKEAIKLTRAALPSTIEIRQDIRTDNDTVLANPTQVHQVIVNFVTNAAHAMRAKGGILEITLDEEILDEVRVAETKTSLSPGPFLKLTVKDTGHGMDPRTLEKIFDPFFTTKAREEGTGLGLATVHGIIRSCEGAVVVESELGKGSRFTIYLPRVKSLDKEKEKHGQPIPHGTERILFVDDEPMIAEMYADMLRFLGYVVECRTDPLDTLNAFRNDPEGYDLVITDMTMPRMTGDELGKEIMRIRPDMPIILCTGFSERMPEDKALELGFCAFAMKPVVIEEIAQKIRQALDGKRR
ncbi:MAG: response regulator [Deltaproteobacteria bacterium]|nr:response regulator [Deltaproteobacteria bacterium]